jgi:hypothetical protein
MRSVAVITFIAYTELVQAYCYYNDRKCSDTAKPHILVSAAALTCELCGVAQQCDAVQYSATQFNAKQMCKQQLHTVSGSAVL